MKSTPGMLVFLQLNLKMQVIACLEKNFYKFLFHNLMIKYNGNQITFQDQGPVLKNFLCLSKNLKVPS
jgi:hypothetical protein